MDLAGPLTRGKKTEMMRKTQVVGLVLVAVCAMCTVLVSAASAETVLWLKKGANVTESLSSQVKGLLELTDLDAPGGAVTVDCEGVVDGSVGPGGEGEVTKLLTSSGAENSEDLIECALVSGKEGLCETSMTAYVIPLSLPWSTQLELSGSHFVDVTLPHTAGDLGFMVTCLTILGETLDECVQASSVQEMINVVGGVEAVSKEEGTGKCSLGGEKEGDMVGSGLTTLNSGEALEVSIGAPIITMVAGNPQFGFEVLLGKKVTEKFLFKNDLTVKYEAPGLENEKAGLFEIAKNGCVGEFPAGDTCEIEMSFEPLEDKLSGGALFIGYEVVSTEMSEVEVFAFEGTGS
jgi:hypothetical protein